MKVQLVRHAKAEKMKSRWDGPEPLRPLTLLGLRQARGLAKRLEGQSVDRILSSPSLRCRQTLEPLSKAVGVRVEVHECLALGESAVKAAELLRSLEARHVVCCTHAELIAELAVELQELGVEVELPPREAERGEDEPRRLAVIDMGSTSFHLLVADVTRAGHLHPVDRERTMLRLGATIATSGHVPEDVCVRAVAAAAEKRERAEDLGAESLIAVGTAALRDADNGPELTARIAEAVQVPVRLLSGVEEARVIFGAFRRRVLLPRGPALGLDLGGGSLELAVGDENDVRFETTLPLGVTRLHGELVGGNRMKKRFARAIRQRVTDWLEPVAPVVAGYAPDLCVAAGGTARALGELALGLRDLHPAPSVNELVIGRKELRAIAERLVRSTDVERLALPGMRRRRADLLPTGALVLDTLVDVLALDGITVCDWGLREGVLLDAVSES